MITALGLAGVQPGFARVPQRGVSKPGFLRFLGASTVFPAGDIADIKRRMPKKSVPSFDVAAQAFHRGRREALFNAMGPKSVLVVVGGTEALRNVENPYPFHPEAYLYYLTGFTEQQSLGIFEKTPEGNRFTLVVQPKDPVSECWLGQRAGVEGSKQIYGADNAVVARQGKKTVEQALEGKDNVYFLPSVTDEKANARVKRWINTKSRAIESQSHRGALPLLPGQQLVAPLRRIKTPYELAYMARAADITVDGQKAAMRAAAASAGEALNENNLHAAIVGTYMDKGATQSFPAIVAAGERTCILHYQDNNKPVKPGDLVLIDTGAEYNGWASDSTRTFPASGQFTEEQKAIYNVVLRAQKAALKAVKPGVTFRQVNRAADEVLVKGLQRLGILPKAGDMDSLIQTLHETAYIHGTSHYVGLDVHDIRGNTSFYRDKDIALEAGNVISVEPGLYFYPPLVEQLDDLDAKWLNIGVRIEDTVVVTEDGHKNLTGRIPKTVPQIEAFMAAASPS